MRAILVFITVLALAGCSKPHLKELYGSLDDNVDYMTYDQAVSAWGIPSRVVSEEDEITAFWRTEFRGMMASYEGNLVYSVPVPHGWELELVFDRQTMKLSDWDYRQW